MIFTYRALSKFTVHPPQPMVTQRISTTHIADPPFLSSKHVLRTGIVCIGGGARVD